jgi:hypothetical protein
MTDVSRFAKKAAESRSNPRYLPGHTVHSDDCMSEWGENARGIMTPETVAANHRLHMGDVYSGLVLIGPAKVGARLHIPLGDPARGVSETVCGKANRPSWLLVHVGTQPNVCPQCEARFWGNN